jgi:RNAse (barnase) inhibitor barstar
MAAPASLRSLATHLQSTKPPWTTLVVLRREQRPESAVKVPEAFTRRIIRGTKCRSAAGLFAEMAQALEFPDYFGHNWDALEECLTDLEWLPGKGYVLCFTGAESILPDDEEEFATFLEVISDAGEAWASGQAGRRPIPFHAVLTVSQQETAKLMHRALPRVSVAPARSSGGTRRRPR